MNSTVLLRVALVAAALGAPAPRGGPSGAFAQDPEAQRAAVRRRIELAYESDIQPLLLAYCASCHGLDSRKGGVDYSRIVSGSMAADRQDLWKRTGAKLAALEMPPERSKQPSAGERARLLSWIASLKRMISPDPGPSPIRRLAASEYRNTLRDLFGTELKLDVELPPDRIGAGFDNSISPLLMEKYLLIADDILDDIVVPGQLNVRWSAAQMPALREGKLDGPKGEAGPRTFAAGGEVFETLSLPSDGNYTIKLKAGALQAGREAARLVVRLDGQAIGEARILAAPKQPGIYSVSAKLTKGRVRLAVTFVNPFTEPPVQPNPPASGIPAKPQPTDPAPLRVRTVVIESVEVIGPPPGRPTDPQSRIFIAAPGKGLGKREAARLIAEQFAFRGFRRPATGKEIERLLAVFDLADHQDEVFTESIKLMLKAVLVSPQFLFRTPGERDGAARGIGPLDNYELASRLSYFLWSSMPDDILFAAAKDGSLRRPEVLDAQARRMIRDPKARALVENFAVPWLELDKLAGMVVEDRKFPLLTRDARKAMYDEGVLLFESILREGRSLKDLIDCDYTFMNASLARIYGVVTVTSARMERVPIGDPNRGGVMTLPGVLMVTSMANRTSPVKRGKWVLEQLLGQAPPDPPDNVEALEKQDTPENAKLTLRQKTELHRSKPDCAGCHRIMDPIGFGLENFDTIGRWRLKDDSGAPLDTLGVLPGNVRFSSPSELKRIVLSRMDEFARTLVGKLLAYALARPLSGYDEVVVEDIAEAAAKDGYRLDAILVRIVTSYPFLNSRELR